MSAHARFAYEIITVFRLSRDEVELLSRVCESHYDLAVRALSIPGLGAILNGARTTLQFADPPTDSCEVRASHRQIDLLLKAMESPLAAAAIDLRAELRQLLRESSVEWERLNGNPFTKGGAR